MPFWNGSWSLVVLSTPKLCYALSPVYGCVCRTTADLCIGVDHKTGRQTDGRTDHNWLCAVSIQFVAVYTSWPWWSFVLGRDGRLACWDGWLKAWMPRQSGYYRVGVGVGVGVGVLELGLEFDWVGGLWCIINRVWVGWCHVMYTIWSDVFFCGSSVELWQHIALYTATSATAPGFCCFCSGIMWPGVGFGVHSICMMIFLHRWGFGVKK